MAHSVSVTADDVDEFVVGLDASVVVEAPDVDVFVVGLDAPVVVEAPDVDVFVVGLGAPVVVEAPDGAGSGALVPPVAGVDSSVDATLGSGTVSVPPPQALNNPVRISAQVQWLDDFIEWLHRHGVGAKYCGAGIRGSDWMLRNGEAEVAERLSGTPLHLRDRPACRATVLHCVR